MALQFFLTYRGVRVKADEPALDWRSIAQILKKSKKFAGITYLITSELEFANNFVNILDQVKANGIAEKVILEIFHQENNTREWVQRFIGKVDIIGSVKTISTTGEEKYKVNTKPTGFEDDFDNNFDVKVNITDNTDLFGNPILSFSKAFEYIRLQPLSIKKRIDIENELPNLFDGGSQLELDADPTNYAYFWTMNFGTKNIQEFGDNFQDNSTLIYEDTTYNPSITISDQDLITQAPNSPLNNSLQILHASEPGDYTLQFDYNLQMTIDLATGGDQRINRYQYAMMVVIVNHTDVLNPVYTIDLLDKIIVENFDAGFLQFSDNKSIDKTYSLVAGDDIFIFPSMLLRLEDVGIGTKVTIDIYEIDFSVLSLKIDALTQFEETNPQSYLIHELFSRLVNKITGQFNAFRSDFYGRTDSEPRTYAEDGEGSLTAILGGTHLRGWSIGTGGDSQRSLNVSMSEVYESESAKHNLGIGIIDGIVRIEKAEFFVDKINSSASLGCIREMKIQTDSKAFYNECEFGYSEWKNTESKTGAGLQEFNTKTNYAPQLSAVKGKYLAVSKYVAAGYTIETVRRQQRSLDTEKETSYDLKKFMIALLRRSGDGSESNPNYINETWDPLEPTNPWSEILGVDFPEEVYNVRWQPARLARNHGNQIRLSVQQNSNDTLLSQTVDGNNLFSSQLKTESSPIVEGENIPGVELGNALYTGEEYIFSTALTDEQIESINNNPYYHIDFDDIKGNNIKGAIKGELSLPFETNIGEFTLKEIQDDVTATTLYNFSGVEQITIPDVPVFERTDTFYFKARVKNIDSANFAILWDNLLAFPSFKGIRISLYGSSSATFPDTVGLTLANNSSGNRIFVYSDAILTPVSGFRTIEIIYDGGSLASGLILKIDGNVETFNVFVDGLTSSIDAGEGVAVGVIKNYTIIEAGMILDTLEMTYAGTQIFKTNCKNDGLTCVDLSSEENDGVIELNGTDPEDFYLTE